MPYVGPYGKKATPYGSPRRLIPGQDRYHLVELLEKAVQDYLVLRERFRHAPPGPEREGISLRLAALHQRLYRYSGGLRAHRNVPAVVFEPLQYLP